MSGSLAVLLLMVVAIRKPEFTEPLKDERVQEGKSIRLQCQFTGEPPPQIQWMCDEVQILPSAMFQVCCSTCCT